MKKAIVTFFLIMMMAAVVEVDVAASPSTALSKAQPSTSIMITQYPPDQVKIGQNITIDGILTSNGYGLGNKLIYREQNINGSWYYNSHNYTTKTNADGSFSDWGYIGEPGAFQFRYAFFGDDQYAQCRSDPFTITAFSS